MGPTTVKRRKLSKPSTETKNQATETEGNPNDVFRKFFESQFRPLDDTLVHKKRVTAAVTSSPTSEVSDADDDDDDESGDEDFEGFSDNGGDDDVDDDDDDDDDDEEEEEEEEEEAEVTVVEHVDASNENALLDKQTRKAILVC
jgi:hypothetical protein